MGGVSHHSVAPLADWEERDGYRVNTPLRTLLDIAESSASWPYLDDAVRDALRRALVRCRQLLEVPVSPLANNRPASAIAAAEEKMRSE